MRDSNGRFIAGSDPGPGRPSGSPERTTKEARELFNRILSRQVDNIEEALDKLRGDPKEYLNTLSKLLPYFIPKNFTINQEEEEDKKWVIEVVHTREELERLEAIRAELDAKGVNYERPKLTETYRDENNNRSESQRGDG